MKKLYTAVNFNVFKPEEFETALSFMALDNWEFVSVIQVAEGVVQYLFCREAKEGELDILLKSLKDKAKRL